MALIDKHPIGVQSGFYVGSMAATGTVLTRIRARRTEGLEIIDITPSEYVVGIDQRAETDLRKVTLTAHFYNDSQTIYNLANNVSFSATGLNSPCDYSEKFMIFIVDSASASQKCYILSDMNAVGGRRIPYKKDAPTVIDVNLEANKYNPDDTVIQKGTAAELGTILGARNPLI